MIKHRVICQYHSIYGSWKSIIPAVGDDVMILFTHVAHMSPNHTCEVLVFQQNVTLALTSKTEVSLDEGRNDIRLTLYDVTLQSQSR